MKFSILFLFLFFSGFVVNAQLSTIDLNPFNNKKDKEKSPRKLYQRNHGAIIGVQRGASTMFEMGGEAHWRKISLKNPRIVGATANMEYNFGNNIIGYRAGMWMKRGRVNLTYGGNVTYFTDFKGQHRYGIGPAVGFRLAGFHLNNGFNILAGDKELDKVNTLYTTLRYYFPIQNKFTWDRKTMQRKKEKRKEREERKEDRMKEKEDKKGIGKLFNF